jgi:DNA-binding NarL/FixJ family response regulator
MVRRKVELSKRQAEIAGYVARGLSDKRIAATLHISIYTVRRHVQEAASHIPGDSTPRHRLTLFFLNITAEELDKTG